MNTPVKLAGFLVGLAAVFGAALGLGAVAGPDASAETAADAAHGDTGGHDGDAGHAAGAPGDSVEPPAGLQVTADGYTLDLRQDTVGDGAATPVAFRVLDADGSAVTAFDVAHGEDLHLVAV